MKIEMNKVFFFCYTNKINGKNFNGTILYIHWRWDRMVAASMDAIMPSFRINNITCMIDQRNFISRMHTRALTQKRTRSE